jgi:phosphopantetheine adenylyltransferase
MLNNNNKNEVKGAMRHQSNESRSVFARIMSTENIQVNFDPKSKDAWFDTKTRVLNMPNWTGMTQEVYVRNKVNLLIDYVFRLQQI